MIVRLAVTVIQQLGVVKPIAAAGKVQHTYLHKHFRPEFVATYAKPLSSDIRAR